VAPFRGWSGDVEGASDGLAAAVLVGEGGLDAGE
jgi:hypothetical protein